VRNADYFGITDIGTSLIYLPKSVYQKWYTELNKKTQYYLPTGDRDNKTLIKPCAYYSNVVGTQACHCPKGARSVYDDIKFHVTDIKGNQVELVVKVEDYVMEVLNEDKSIDHCAVLMDWIDDYDLYHSNSGKGIYLGDSFIRSFYMIHNNERV